jgi:FdhE protein
MKLGKPAGLKDGSEETADIILPSPNRVFEKRSERLRFLAPGHAVGAYLEAMAQLAQAQLVAAQAPSAGNGEAPVPVLPFDVCNHFYGEGWQKALRLIISEMQLAPLPEPSQAALSRLGEASPAMLEGSAHAILSGNHGGIDLAASPFLAAALQVYWTGLASRVQAAAAQQPAHSCPVCASPPVAGVVLSGRKLRYLCCSLCATHWCVPRLTCTSCGSTADLSYFAFEGNANGIKAEACGHCSTYLKLFYLESNPDAEAFADDLATLALDLSMAEKGYSRSGINLFLLSLE